MSERISLGLFRRVALSALVLAIAAPASAADDTALLLGRWRTQVSKGTVEIRRCGPALCGHIVDAPALRRNADLRDVLNKDASLRNRRIRNLMVLSNFTPNGGGEWKGGPVYDPATGDGARQGYILLDGPNALRVKGCIAAFLCRSQTWTRVR